MGVITYAVSPRVGSLAALLKVEGASGEDLLVLSKRGLAIRTPVKHIPRYSRATAGVRVMNLLEGDEVASAFVVKEA